ncbi:MAG: secretion system protein E [Opitutaceae bacterium]|jgi:general secretion pathway protein E|nr:secretion system protein E [Opitutaceae bacterium]|tara:strand:+ start:2236 stop:3924 length:1689 start_codon:yes stop_codon:yes gene_type:complete
MAVATEVLPTAIAAKLSEASRSELDEKPLSERMAALAAALDQPLPDTIRELADSTGLPVARDLKIDLSARPILPARLASEYQIVPLEIEGSGEHELHLAASWVPEDEVLDWVRTFTSREIRWHLAAPDKVQQLIRDNFGVGAGSLENADESELALSDLDQDGDADEDAAVVRFVTEVITQAIEDGATDIHFEPQEGQLRIRYRVDGLLVPVPLPENLTRFQDAIISRLKIMAHLNISEKRLPQDGRITFRAGSNSLDIRVSTIPTIYAESISLRLLNLRKEAYDMDRIGLDEEEKAKIAQVLDSPHGIVLVTGPTGSGKSTSLNAFLREINSTDLRIVTVEDPIEYEVPGANQIQVRPEIGLSFAGALRHILRQDPDVIMVGEVRDRETADIAIQASLTGHLVFTTLHTNDAAGTITRLIDMGIEPFLIASAVELVIAQRLVRQLCPQCSKATPVNESKLRESLAALGLDPQLANGVETLHEAVGCDHCRGTGYRGRIGLFEILRPNEEMHDMIVQRESTRTIERSAVKHGMRTLAESGWAKIRSGKTTVEEMMRVVSANER